MPYLYISLQNKFYLDIFIFGLLRTYFKMNTLSRYFLYLIYLLHLENNFFYTKLNFQSLLFYAFTPLNGF